jgi:hypothetical protein
MPIHGLLFSASFAYHSLTFRESGFLIADVKTSKFYFTIFITPTKQIMEYYFKKPTSAGFDLLYHSLFPIVIKFSTEYFEFREHR